MLVLIQVNVEIQVNVNVQVDANVQSVPCWLTYRVCRRHQQGGLGLRVPKPKAQQQDGDNTRTLRYTGQMLRTSNWRVENVCNKRGEKKHELFSSLPVYATTSVPLRTEPLGE